MTTIESRISPDGIVMRNEDNEVVFDTSRAMLAVLGNWAGTVKVGGWTGPASGYDTPHMVDHDIAAAPLGTENLLAFLEFSTGVRVEFSGSVQLRRLTFRRNASWARMIALEWWLAPVIVGGRIKIRERWWYHGTNSSALQGWQGGATIPEQDFQYDIRALAFVGGV